MKKVQVYNEEDKLESVSIVYKDVWYRLEGEEQNTYIELSEFVEEENIDYKNFLKIFLEGLLTLIYFSKLYFY